MLLYYDLDAGQWVQSPGSRFSPAKPGFIRGDSAAITLKFCRGAAVVELDAAATASLGVKQDGKFDGSYLASTGTVVVANHSKAITSTAYGDPATTFLVPGHGRATGETVTISGDTSTPPANGIFTVTVTDADHFSVPFTTTVDGTGGTMTPALEPSYSFAPSFNTAAIDTALGVQGGGGSTADDISALAGNLEVTWTIAGVIASTARLPVTIWNDVNKGDEGASSYANPPYPTPNKVVTAYPLLTGLTGGTTTDLDGQATIGGAMTAGKEVHLHLAGVPSAWRLRARTGETENSAAGRVIPDDDSTLLWEQIA